MTNQTLDGRSFKPEQWKMKRAERDDFQYTPVVRLVGSRCRELKRVRVGRKDRMNGILLKCFSLKTT